MAGVYVPQKKNPVQELFQIGGTVAGGIVGGIAGGPPGAVGGAVAGNALGGFAGQQASPTKQMPGSSGGGESAAMARAAQMKSQDSLASLKQAEAALPQVPEAVRQQYAGPIIQARMLEERKRGIA
jgi:hypothetical protein